MLRHANGDCLVCCHAVSSADVCVEHFVLLSFHLSQGYNSTVVTFLIVVVGMWHERLYVRHHQYV